ncbi:MAG: hypothetical protein CL828_03185 [Crocinitomicaceae bacterium]|nr:hypothetical protein [Crocinitomicaceae bacterium]
MSTATQEPKSLSPDLSGGGFNKGNALQRLGTFCLVAFPFLDLFLFRYTFRLFPGPLGYGPFLCMYALLPFWVLRFRFPIRVALTLGLVGLIGSSGVLEGIVTSREFIKILGSLVLPYLYYWYLWQHLGEDVIRGFRLYLKGAFVVSMLGLLIFLDSLFPVGIYAALSAFIKINLTPAAFGIRIASTLGEPTYFANSVAPAGLFALWRLFFRQPDFDAYLKGQGLWLKRWQALAILVALVLTYSTMALVGLLVSFALILLIKRQLRTLLFSGFLVLLTLTIARSVPEINERLVGLQNASEVAETDVHGSSAILYNHAAITWENFSRNPWIGGGLGSHPVATKKYSILRNTTAFAYAEQNAPDASSMFLRITSELGLFGILLTLFFLRTQYFKVQLHDHEGLVMKLISAAFLVTLLLQLFRQGNFILNGFPFFVYGYFFAYQQFKSLN